MSKNHLVICDIDGMRYPSNEMRTQWDGLVVHKKNYTSRHPQDLIKSIPDDTSVSPVRMEAADVFVSGAEDITFGLVDEFNNPVVSENGEYIQCPPTSGELYNDSDIPVGTF